MSFKLAYEFATPPLQIKIPLSLEEDFYFVVLEVSKSKWKRNP